jgi:hypothetical protein
VPPTLYWRISSFTATANILEIWIEDPPKAPYRDITQYMRQRRQRERDKRLGHLREVAEALRKVGVDVLLPKDVHFRHPFRQVALAYAVKDPCHPENELECLVKALVPRRDTADFFWLVPTHGRMRLAPGGIA